MQRGKGVDVFISYEDYTRLNAVFLQYKKDIAAQYLTYFRQMAEDFGLKDDVTVTQLGRCPEVFSMEEGTVDEEEIWGAAGKGSAKRRGTVFPCKTDGGRAISEK